MPINESAKDTKGETIPPPHMITNGLLMSTPADSNAVCYGDVFDTTACTRYAPNTNAYIVIKLRS